MLDLKELRYFAAVAGCGSMTAAAKNHTICLLYRADMHRTKAAMRVKDELVAYGKRLDGPDAAT